jgi:hypothetical protein
MRLCAAIHKHHDYHERRQALVNQKLVQDRRVLPDTWLTQSWSYVVTLFSLYNFIAMPIDFALGSIQWVEKYWYEERWGS